MTQDRHEHRVRLVPVWPELQGVRNRAVGGLDLRQQRRRVLERRRRRAASRTAVDHLAPSRRAPASRSRRATTPPGRTLSSADVEQRALQRDEVVEVVGADAASGTPVAAAARPGPSRERRRGPGRRTPPARRGGCRRRSPRRGRRPRRPAPGVRAAPGAAAAPRPAGRRRARRRAPPAGPPCLRGRRTGRASARRAPSTGARARASATSCEPSSWTPARPSATAGTAPGSPPSSTTPYGENGVGVPGQLLHGSTRPGRATSTTRGGSLSAASRASSSSAPTARDSSSTTQRGWLCATEAKPTGSVAGSGATRRTHPARSCSDTRRSTALPNPAGPWPTRARSRSTVVLIAAWRGHPHREQLVGAQP